MLDPLGRIGLLTLYLSIAAAQNFQYQGQRNYVVKNLFVDLFYLFVFLLFMVFVSVYE